MASGIVFVSLTHGKATDCHLANASLKEKLEHYSFNAYLVDKISFRCPNNKCNLSFLFILRKAEHFRLRNNVKFEVRPTFLLHKSLNELFALDKKSRKSVDTNSIGVQCSVETANALIDACPESRVLHVQTDLMVGKQDNGNQTEIASLTEMSCQTDVVPENSIGTGVEISASNKEAIEQHVTDANFFPAKQQDDASFQQPQIPKIIAVGDRDLIVHAHEKEQGESPLRSLEIQQDDDDDDVVFIESRPRDLNTAPVREVKLEEPEEQEQVESPQQPHAVTEKDIKEEPVEPSTPVALVVERISKSLSSAVLVTPKTSSSRDRITEGSAKRMKFSDAELCGMCWEMTYFSSLDEYCAHVLDRHVSLYRFKCTACPMRCFDLRHATRHIQAHSSPDEDNNLTFEELISREIPDEHIARFMRAAEQCYPESFRNIPIDKIVEIIQEHP